MKKFCFSILLLVFIACASGTKETSVADSTVVNDTAAVMAPGEQPVSIPEAVITGDTSQLTARYEEVSRVHTMASEHWYAVRISTDQYEASSEVTWYFDESFSPRYFKMTWSAEGNEGSTELYLENNAVTCAQEEEGDVLEQWCSTTGGTRTSWGEDDNVSKTRLAAEYGTNTNESFRRYFDILKALLKEGEITAQDENSYTIRIEKTVNYGNEYTESTEVSIGKNVYEAIK